MNQLFTQDFFKFLLGFFGLILLSLAVIFTVQTVDQDPGTGQEVRTLPTATTSADN